MIGTTISHYKITEMLGAGGMGEVYLADDTKLHRKVALKFLPEKFSSDPEFKSRFEHEARAAAALNHPNIITVHDLGEHEGRLYIVMEHVAGRTLADLIDADEITVRKALELGAQICDGLHAAHNAGIVHRDIKPANILIDEQGRARILDFGLAKSRRATTDTKVGSTLGTVMYESPEQSRGEPVDHRSDLFSFGSVLYEMITGVLAFQGEYEGATRYAIAHEAVEPLARYKKNVPIELEHVVAKLLEKEPEMRYQTASGVLADLKRIQRDLTQATPAVSRIETSVLPEEQATAKPSKSSGKKFVIPTAVAIVLVALALVFKPWKFELASTHEAQATESRLAIMYFDDLTDPDNEKRQGEIIADLLITDISASSDLQVVSSQRLYDILKLLGKEGVKRIDRDVASQVAHKAQSRWMLTGKILRTEPSVVLTAQLVEVETGNVLSSSRIDGAAGEDVFTLVDKLTDDITASLNVSKSDISETFSAAAMMTTSPEAYRHYLDGVEFMNQYHFEKAVRAFDEAIAADSNFTMAYYRRSMVGPNQGEFIEEAVRRIDRVSEQDRLRIFARQAFFNEGTAEYIALLEDLIRKYPGDKEQYFILGNAYGRGDHADRAKAIENYLKAIAVDPLYKVAYNQLAYEYQRMGNMDSSLWAINEYIKIAPNEPNPYDTRGELYELNGQVESAIESYRKAQEIDPEFSESLKKLAYLYLFSGQAADAERLMQERAAHAEKVERSGGRAGLMNVSIYLGKLKQAHERLEYRLEGNRLELDNGQVKSHYFRQRQDFAMMVYDMTGDDSWLDSAIQHNSQYMRMIFADTSNSDRPFYAVRHVPPTLDLVKIHLKRGAVAEADSALASLQRGIVDSFYVINTFWGLEYRYELAVLRGEFDSAVTFVKALIEEYPNNRFENYVRLGRAHLKAGRTGEAVEALELAANRYDNSRRGAPDLASRIYYWLGLAYEESGWNSRAVTQYERLLEIWRDADDNLQTLQDVRDRLVRLKA